jgi:hypothetical protein
VEALAEQVGVTRACDALGVPRSSLYAARQPRAPKTRLPAAPLRAIAAEEKAPKRAQKAATDARGPGGWLDQASNGLPSKACLAAGLIQ